MTIEYAHPNWSDSQSLALLIASKITAVLSIIGSGYIVYSMLRQQVAQARPNPSDKIHNRLLFGLSVCDVISSFSVFLGSWMMPRGHYNQITIWGDVGTWATCEAQGFMILFGYQASGVYNVLISLYFLLFIKYNWTEERFKKYDRWFHGVAFIPSIVFSTVAVIDNVFNPNFLFCWIGSYPNDGIQILRGERYIQYLLAGFLAPVLIGGISITLMMVMLYRHVSKVEKQAQRWVISSDQPHNGYASQVLRTAALYIVGYFMIYIPSFLNIVYIEISSNCSFLLYFINALLLPSQGVINCYTYLRLARKEKSAKNRNMDDQNCPQGSDVIVGVVDEVNLSVGDILAQKGEVSEQHIKMDDHNCPRGLDIIVSDINEVNSSVGDNSDNNDERSSSSIQSRQKSNSDDSSCFSVSMNFFEFLGS